MNKIYKNKLFITGFLVGISIIILLNIFFPAENNFGAGYLYDFQGFPFTFYQSGYEERDGGNYVGEILWFGLIADIFISIVFGFILGFIFKFTLSENGAQKLE